MMEATTEDEMENPCKDDEVLNLLSQCGETSVLNVSEQNRLADIRECHVW
jgi:hypothetical protein